MLSQSRNCLFIVANQVGGYLASVIGSEAGKPRNLYRNKLAVNLHLGRASGRKNQVADFFRSTQHRCQQNRSSYSAAAGIPFQRNRNWCHLRGCHSILITELYNWTLGNCCTQNGEQPTGVELMSLLYLANRRSVRTVST